MCVVTIEIKSLKTRKINKLMKKIEFHVPTNAFHKQTYLV